ncbi:MAG: carbon-nitrogen hydrolase family protein [Candidatus Riflebacteria bacterium]|nr:carbon-nitrogen hydrolase family protein [Candidatus Riflebacteria bacterium]
MSTNKIVRTAVVQAAPIIMDREQTVDKAVSLAREAASKGAKIVIFPEAFIPAYPRGLTFGTRIGARTEEGRKDWARYWENSVLVPGPTTDILGEVARQTEIYLVMGIIERESEGNQSTIFCTIIYFGPDGTLLGKHRKLKPTGSELLIWGEGDGSTLSAVDTPYGRMGGLICWENYMPLARAAMYEEGLNFYLTPTADSREEWQSTIRHIALESRCFVLNCNQFVTKAMYPTNLACYNELESCPDIMCRGGSAIISPMGQYLAGPVWDKEVILLADLDLNQIPQSRFDLDVTGHYSRPDVFQLTVDKRKKVNIKKSNDFY